MVGFGGSSTRSEIAGGILAIASPHPTHIGTDSAAFLLKANKLHHLIQQDKTPRNPGLSRLTETCGRSIGNMPKPKEPAPSG